MVGCLGAEVNFYPDKKHGKLTQHLLTIVGLTIYFSAIYIIIVGLLGHNITFSLDLPETDRAYPIG